MKEVYEKDFTYVTRTFAPRQNVKSGRRTGCGTQIEPFSTKIWVPRPVKCRAKKNRYAIDANEQSNPGRQLYT